MVLVEAVREFAREVLLPMDRRWDVDESSVAEVLPRLGEMGLLALSIPESLDGLACPYRTYAAIIHELAYFSPSTAVTVAVHNMVGRILAKFTTDPLRQELLSRWGDPVNFSAFALSEANAGSDAAAVRATATAVEGGYRVNGEKMWISNGMNARWFLTLVRLADAPERDGLCAMLIDGRASGLGRTKIYGKMGIRGSETAVIHLTDVFVPERYLVGPRGHGLHVCLSSLNEGRIGIAAQATGIAEACLAEMVSYARQREQFHRPIGAFQAVGEMLASSAVELEAAKLLVWRAAADVEKGRLSPMAGSMAKLYATECANRIAYRAIQVHGGAGYVRECRVEQLYRDARVTTIYEGTSEIQRLVIARELDSAGVPTC